MSHFMSYISLGSGHADTMSVWGIPYPCFGVAPSLLERHPDVLLFHSGLRRPCPNSILHFGGHGLIGGGELVRREVPAHVPRNVGDICHCFF